MKKEQLVELGLNDDQIKEVFKLNGQAIENVKSNVSAIEAEKLELNERLSELEKTKSTLEDQLNTRPTQETLNQLLQEKESLVSQIDSIKLESESKLQEVTFNSMLESSLRKAGVRENGIEPVKSVLKLDEIKLIDGKLEGFDSEIDRLNTDYSWFFESNDSKPKFTQPTGATSNVVEGFKDMGYAERLQLKQNNPDLYNSLIR